MELNLGAKIWLWIVFVLNCIVLVRALVATMGVMMYVTTFIAVILILCLVVEVAMIAGVGILLFRAEKRGFYIILVSQVVGVVLNLLAGTFGIRTIVGAVVCPLITYLFLVNQWEELE